MYVVFQPPYRFAANAFEYAAGCIEKESERRITLAGRNTSHVRYIRPEQVVARLESEQEADFLLQAINGARGEYENRERRAREACAATIADLIERATS